MYMHLRLVNVAIITPLGRIQYECHYGSFTQLATLSE